MRTDDPERIGFFTQQLREFFLGVEGMQPGIHTHFKEKSLSMRLLRERPVRMLWGFKEFLEFVQYFEQTIDRSVQTNDWKAFLDDIYPRLNHFIKISRDRYGEEEFAKLLENNRKQFHQGAYQWDESMKAALARFRSPGYQNGIIVNPASEAIVKVFSKRIEELKNEEEHALANAAGMLQREMRLLEGREARSLVLFRRKITARIRKIKGEHKDAMRIFSVVEMQYLRIYEEILKYLPEEDGLMARRFAAGAQRLAQWDGYAINLVQSQNVSPLELLPSDARHENIARKIGTVAEPLMDSYANYLRNKKYVERLMKSLGSVALELRGVMGKYPFLITSRAQNPEKHNVESAQGGRRAIDQQTRRIA